MLKQMEVRKVDGVVFADMDKKLKEYLAMIGKRGGQARTDSLSSEQRRAAARKAAQARWNKNKKEKA